MVEVMVVSSSKHTGLLCAVHSLQAKPPSLQEGRVGTTIPLNGMRHGSLCGGQQAQAQAQACLGQKSAAAHKQQQTGVQGSPTCMRSEGIY